MQLLFPSIIVSFLPSPCGLVDLLQHPPMQQQPMFPAFSRQQSFNSLHSTSAQHQGGLIPPSIPHQPFSCNQFPGYQSSSLSMGSSHYPGCQQPLLGFQHPTPDRSPYGPTCPTFSSGAPHCQQPQSTNPAFPPSFPTLSPSPHCFLSFSTSIHHYLSCLPSTSSFNT